MIDSLIGRIQKDGVDPKELERARTFFRAQRIGSLQSALNRAQLLGKYEILDGGEGFFGSIPSLPGVWASERTLEACRTELIFSLEDWLLFSLSRQERVPVLEGIDLTVRQVA